LWSVAVDNAASGLAIFDTPGTRIRWIQCFDIPRLDGPGRHYCKIGRCRDGPLPKNIPLRLCGLQSAIGNRNDRERDSKTEQQ
jgi:hypothetical protein